MYLIDWARTAFQRIGNAVLREAGCRYIGGREKVAESINAGRRVQGGLIADIGG